MKRELAAIALVALAAFLLGAVALSRGTCAIPAGPFGPVGSCVRSLFVATVGLPAAILLALVPAAHGLRLFGRIESSTDRSWLLFLTGAVVLLPITIAVIQGSATGSDLRDLSTTATGGWGIFAGFYMLEALGGAGTTILLGLLLCALTAATLAWNPIRVLIGRRSAAPTASPETVAAAVDIARPALLREPPPEEMPAIDPGLMTSQADAEGPATAAADAPPRKRAKRIAELAAAGAVPPASDISVAEDPGTFVDDELPPIDLLTPAPPRADTAKKGELDAMGVKLMEALRTFKVEGELVGRTTGPVVTQYEIAPAAGVKVRQIANLANDLALAMRAPSIRIVAPIPGRGAVGVEVPNPVSEMVAFRELIESRDFQGARAALPIALGKDLEGRPVVADLAKMPHLLIAGATGSGKSVCVNTLITSLVYRHTPQTLRFLMVDPKMVELSLYNALPHLRHKVITDNRDAASILKWAVLEMQERYELLAANGARNVQDFNRRVSEGASLQLPKNFGVAFEDRTYKGGVLPYIVVVIDELADLMMTVQGEVERPLAMLAQKARAIGIHLILATQRPSVNVITGLIKANFPSRIAFRVASQVDSRTILDGMGAESLLGNGDMLFIPPGKSEPSRLQGAFIPSEDTERLVQWYIDRRERRRQALAALPVEVGAGVPEADILEVVRQREALEQGATGEGDGDAGAEDRDKLFREAAEVVIQHKLGSTSLLQRRMKIGYGRAARIIDQLHAAGVLGPPDGSKPREILIGLEDLDRICGPR